MNDDGTFRIDHLERRGGNEHLWCRPTGRDDIQDTEEIQILPIKVVGEWDFSEDKPVFLLDNVADIQNSFNDVCKLFDI